MPCKSCYDWRSRRVRHHEDRAEESCWHYRATYDMGFFAFRLPNIYCFMHDSKTL